VLGRPLLALAHLVQVLADQPEAPPLLAGDVNARLFEAGYWFAVDADLDALTPDELTESFRNWRAERSR
jgi:hypothetical protein